MLQEADHILIPLLDGRSALAQASRREGGRALVLITPRVATPATEARPIPPRDVHAALVVDTQLLTPDQWPTIGYDAVPRFADLAGWDLGADDHLIDPAVVEAFCNALHGLYPWDGFPDPDFFANMLRPEHRGVPDNARMTADLPRPQDDP